MTFQQANEGVNKFIISQSGNFHFGIGSNSKGY